MTFFPREFLVQWNCTYFSLGMKSIAPQNALFSRIFWNFEIQTLIWRIFYVLKEFCHKNCIYLLIFFLLFLNHETILLLHDTSLSLSQKIRETCCTKKNPLISRKIRKIGITKYIFSCVFMNKVKYFHRKFVKWAVQKKLYWRKINKIGSAKQKFTDNL